MQALAAQISSSVRLADTVSHRLTSVMVTMTAETTRMNSTVEPVKYLTTIKPYRLLKVLPECDRFREAPCQNIYIYVSGRLHLARRRPRFVLRRLVLCFTEFASLTPADVAAGIARLPDKSSAADPLPVSTLKTSQIYSRHF